MSMRPRRTALICSSLTLSLALVTLEQPARAAEGELQRSFTLGPTPRVELRNLSGRVRVEGGKRETVELRARKEGGSAEERARVSVEVSVSGSTLQVRTRCPEEGALHRGASAGGEQDRGACGRVSVHYELRLPRGARLEVKAVSSPVTVAGVEGALELSTVSGPITVSGAGAAARRLRSVSGAVTCSGGSGELRASTVSGPLTLERPASTGGELEARAVSGPVRLRLARSARADLELRSLSGPLQSTLPLTAEERDRHRLRGKLGGGGARVRASTVSGPVEVGPL